jgi:uridylate kinase
LHDHLFLPFKELGAHNTLFIEYCQYERIAYAGAKITSDMQPENIIISVGGSMIVPGDIDTTFLSSFKALIEHEIDHNGRSFVIIAGGGKTARKYMDAARHVSDLTPDDVDWLGIHATRLNGHLLRAIFRDHAHPVMITNPDDILDIEKETPLIVASGYRPGASTDLRAVQIAHRRGATKVINLSNIDHVYTADPKKDKDAVPIETISWGDFRKLIPAIWDPGLSSPFDPVAAKEAELHGIEVAILNGTKIDELRNCIEGKPFIGTRIHA